MKKIKDYTQYESGNNVQPHVLYMETSDPIIVQGSVDFQVMGTVLMNGVKIANTSLRALLSKPTQFEIMEDSALVFHQAPQVAKETPELVPCTPVPEMQDEMIRQMHMLFNQWAIERGMLDGKVIYADHYKEGDSQLDDDMDFDDDYDINTPLDEEIQDESVSTRSGDVSESTDQADDVQLSPETSNKDDVFEGSPSELSEDSAEDVVEAK